jgi:VCBS repeat-containing protein
MKVYQTLQKKKHSQKLGENKEQEESINIQSKDNTQKHKNTNGGHKKEQ